MGAKNKDLTPNRIQPVDSLREDTVDVPHASRQIGARCLDNEVVVVGHQAVGVADPRESSDDLAQELEKSRPIGISEEDPASIIAATGDVVQSSFEFDSQWTRHGPSLAWRRPKIKT